MKFIITLFLLALTLAPASGQSRQKKTVKSAQRAATPQKKKTVQAKSKAQLNKERADMQKARKKSQQEVVKLNRSIKANLDSVLILDNQIGRHQASIDSLNGSIGELESSITTLEGQLDGLQAELTDKKSKYAKALVYMRRNRTVQSKMMFVFSADNLAQMLRRMRYMREYSTYQKAQGEAIKQKQQEVRDKQNALLAAKAQKEANMQSVRQKQTALKGMKTSCESKITFLNKNLATVQTQIKEYQKRETEINAQIERIIQQEIAEAKRKAELERQRKAAEAKRRAEEQRKANERRLAAAKAAREKALADQRAAKSAAEKKKAKSDLAKATSEVEAVEASNKRDMAKIEKWSAESDADRKLSSSFTSNKGRLPMPITGSYSIVGHYGNYTVAGLRNVTLNNKGIDIRGKQGAQARAVFNGQVSSVFQYGSSYIVMVRHGAYISVYSGLSSVVVSKGDNVSTRTPLGAVGTDSSGNVTLHFQLRKESTRLNPEQWVR